jgi:hypothetical protein
MSAANEYRIKSKHENIRLLKNLQTCCWVADKRAGIKDSI